MAITLAINGFGRIGRQLARQILSNPHSEIHLKAINSLETAATGAHLLKYDSSYGVFPSSVEHENNRLIIDNQPIAWSNNSTTENLYWPDIDIVLECSGAKVFHDSQHHISAGTKKVIITAASSNSDVTLCMGVNHQKYTPDSHHVMSASSCTTNCIAPAAKLINDHFSIISSMATVIHSYTNTQNILDNVHDDLRRSRSATQSIIPTHTSAAWQVPLVIPELSGKFEGLAVRVPTPLMHLADATFILKKQTSQSEILSIFSEASRGSLNGILSLSSLPLVSSDYKGSRHSCLVDTENIYVNGDMVKLLLWHDNEYSYCCRVLDLVQYIGRHLNP